MTLPAESSIEAAPRVRTLNAFRITVLIISASTPLATIVGTAPLGFAFGGASLPAMYVLSGVLIFLFCVGYTQMSRRITRPGAFYVYITRGLGRTAGVSGAWLALAAYTPFLAGCFAIAPYYGHLILEQELGINIPWPLYALFLFTTVGIAAYRRIDFSAKLLAVFVGLEVLVLVVLDVAMFAKDGTSLLPTDTFSTDISLSTGFGVALVFAIMSFVGFESAALYAPETKNPRRAIPRATYAAVLTITVLYGLTTWMTVGVFGADKVQNIALAQFGDLYFNLADQYVGGWLRTTMALLMLVAQFAVALAITNATARYTHALAKEGLLPAWLGKSHASFKSPQNAIVFLLGFSAVLIFGGWALGFDPYLDLSSVMFGVGAVGIVAIQAAACLSVIVFFLRESEGFHWLKTGLAPALGLAGLVTAVYLMIDSFSFVSGKDNGFVGILPWLLLASAAGGAVYAQVLKRNHPDRYQRLGRGDSTSDFDDLVAADAWEDSPPR